MNLRETEARLHVLNACGSEPCQSPDCESARLALALLAVLKETRYVLRMTRNILEHAHLTNRVLEIDAVLAKVRDE